MIGRIGRFLLMVVPLCLNASAESKHSLKPNMVHLYAAPPAVQTWTEMFTKGMWYGRLRTHLFVDRWSKELQKGEKSIRKNSAIVGVGGSAVFKSAYWNGFGMTAGLYMTDGIGNLNRKEAYLYRAGKDTFSRYDRLKSGKTYMATLAEAYLEYRNAYIDVKAGRQIFESFLTKSNDGKMIPNTFEGVTFKSKGVPQTDFKAAYLTRQKLRDHTSFHHLLAYADKGTYLYERYRENDDAGMHKDLTLSKLKAKGIDDRLIVLEAKNRSITQTTLTLDYTAVPKLLSYAMMQIDHDFTAGEWRLSPGLRYMRQFDNGAGVIGGANKRELTTGYKDPKSLDSWLLGLRLDAVYKAWKLRFAYTKVADKADIIAPWRGFPTGGFTRLMGQYNWDANTKTYVLAAGYDLKAYDLKIVGSYGYQDFDDSKAAVSADNHVATVEFMQGFGMKHHTYWKLRYAHVWGDDHTSLPAASDKYKLDPSYDEFRFEVDYLF